VDGVHNVNITPFRGLSSVIFTFWKRVPSIVTVNALFCIYGIILNVASLPLHGMARHFLCVFSLTAGSCLCTNPKDDFAPNMNIKGVTYALPKSAGGAGAEYAALAEPLFDCFNGF
jgi:hypothetical protein